MNRPIIDLLIRDVVNEENSESFDIAVDGGYIIDKGTHLEYQARKIYSGQGCMVSPAFVDPHTHLDKAFVMPSKNVSGTLEEALRIMEGGQSFIDKNINKNIVKALVLAIQHGILFIRTHVDIATSEDLQKLQKILEIREAWKDFINIQIVAFPQYGVVKIPDLPQILRQAIQMGADLLGGIPAIEESPKAAKEHINMIFSLAHELDVLVDMHIDENDDPNSHTLEMLADVTKTFGYEGKVNATHCCSLAAYPDDYAKYVIEKVAESGISVITNPMVNLVMQGRNDTQPIRRGITRVKELMAAGVNVSCGNDNLRDVFFPFGKFDLLEVAYITALTAQLTGTYEMKAVLDMPRYNAARILHLPSYGLKKNCSADLILMHSSSVEDLLSSKPPRKAVFRKGILICETEVSTSMLETLENINKV